MPASPSAETVFRLYETDSVPSSGAHAPIKRDVRNWAAYIEGLATLSFAANSVYDDKADLTANLVPGANSAGLVIGDPTAGEDGLYMKVGATGLGSWQQLTDFVPGMQFVVADDSGAGTANAIEADSTIGVSASGNQLIRLNVFEANSSSPVTVEFNGSGVVYTIKTSSGTDIVAGGLTPGPWVGSIVDNAFMLESQQATATLYNSMVTIHDDIVDLFGSITNNLAAFPDSETFRINNRDVIFVPDGMVASSLAYGTGLKLSVHTTLLEGYYNLAIGIRCLDSNTTGSYNTGAGYEVMENLTTGKYNTAFGEAAGIYLVSGNSNTLIGWKAGLGILGEGQQYSNTFVGAGAAINVRNAANNNVCVGVSAFIDPDFAGQYNNVVGNVGLKSITTGDNNNGIGYNTGPNLTTGSSNLFLGHNTGGGIITGGFNVIIGLINSLSPTLGSTIIIGDGAGIKRIYIDSTNFRLMTYSTTERTTFEVANNVGAVVNWAYFRPSLTGQAVKFAVAGDGTDANINIEFQTWQSSARATRMTLGLGMKVGAATGGTAGDMGAGTVNVAVDIYKNGTAFTNPDYVFEHAYSGKIEMFASRDGAANYNGLMSLSDLRAYTRENFRLPGISDEPAGLFARGDVALEKIEEAHLYILELHERVRDLEAELATLKRAA